MACDLCETLHLLTEALHPLGPAIKKLSKLSTQLHGDLFVFRAACQCDCKGNETHTQALANRTFFE